MVRTAASSSSRSAAMPVSANRASTASSSAMCRGAMPSSTACGHCESPASGSQAFRRRRTRLRPLRASAPVSDAGRVQQASTMVSAASRVPRKRERSSSTSPRSRPRRLAWRPALAHARSTRGPASSGARSSIRWSAWPGSERRLLRRRQASSTKRSSSAAPVIERAPSRRNRRDQRTVAAGQQTLACRGLRQQETLQRLAPQRPARRQRVFESTVHRCDLRAWAGPRSGRRRPGRRCRRGR